MCVTTHVRSYAALGARSNCSANDAHVDGLCQAAMDGLRITPAKTCRLSLCNAKHEISAHRRKQAIIRCVGCLVRVMFQRVKSVFGDKNRPTVVGGELARPYASVSALEAW